MAAGDGNKQKKLLLNTADKVLYLCEDNSEESEKLYHLLVEPHSRYHHERHDHALSEFLDYHANGFRLCELEHIHKILIALIEGLENRPVNHCHIFRILKLCGRGVWWKQRMQDEVEFLQSAADLISYLGSLLLKQDIVLKTRTTETLLSLCTSNDEVGPEVPLNERWKRIKPEFIIKCFEKSTVHVPVMQLLKNKTLSLDVIVDGLMILKRTAKRSAIICENILKASCVEELCLLLNVPGDEHIGHRIKFWCMEVLGVLLRSSSRKAVDCLSNKDCVQCLRNGLLNIIHQSNDKRMRQLRNDFLQLVCCIVHENPHLPYLVPGFAQELVLLATYPEVKHPHPLFVSQQLAQVPEDYQMKQLLYILVLLIARTPEIKQIVDPQTLLEALTMYLYPVLPPNDALQAKRCPVSYKRKLQELALQSLAEFAPMFISAYIEERGNVRILEQINWCYVRGFFKNELVCYERDVYAKALLQVLVQVAGTQDLNILEELSILAGVPLIINILKDTIEVPLNATCIDSVLEIETNAFIILAALCDAKDEFKVWIGTGGLALVVKFLHIMTKEEAILLPKYNHLLASCINFIWCTVVGVQVVEKKFRDLEGIFLLLEILNVAHPSMQSMLLACLMDLCDNHELVESCLEWRGPGEQTLPQLFCRLWREEERRIGALRDEKDKITDVDQPLMGMHQLSQPVKSHPSDELSPAVLDVSENFRVNIYGIVERMKDVGSRSSNGTSHPSELMKLSLENMMTLAVIEGYLDLKGFEVWNEIFAELEDDDLQPLLSDQELINTVVRVNHTRSQSAMNFQEQFSNLSHSEKHQEEKQFYQQMHMWRDQKMLSLERIHTFLAATTDYSILRSIKEREQILINLKRNVNTIKRLEEEKTHLTAKKQLRP